MFIDKCYQVVDMGICGVVHVGISHKLRHLNERTYWKFKALSNKHCTDIFSLVYLLYLSQQTIKSDILSHRV
jgi:hypothetical protein